MNKKMPVCEGSPKTSRYPVLKEACYQVLPRCTISWTRFFLKLNAKTGSLVRISHFAALQAYLAIRRGTSKYTRSGKRACGSIPYETAISLIRLVSSQNVAAVFDFFTHWHHFTVFPFTLLPAVRAALQWCMLFDLRTRHMSQPFIVSDGDRQDFLYSC